MKNIHYAKFNRRLYRFILKVFVVFSLFWLTPNIFSQDIENIEYYKEWVNNSLGEKPVIHQQAKKLSRIKVRGNRFVNSKGDTVLFRGLSISDPDKIEKEGHWNKEHFIKVKEMGATLVRIPVHPSRWRERTPEKYLQLLTQAINWCTELDMYVIIDWHSIGNLEMELFQGSIYNTSKRETYEFWRTIASYFNGHNTVAFYEIFNEPTNYHGKLGPISWTDWKKINENIIELIRAYDNETIPLVAGFDWAFDLKPLQYDPINAERIAYTVHPYPMKRERPWPPKWEESFGFASDRYPIIATEFGFHFAEGQELMESKKTGDDHYGNIIINYLEEKGISWTAWVFDPEWFPRMFESWDSYKLTESGQFFKKAMHKELNFQNQSR